MDNPNQPATWAHPATPPAATTPLDLRAAMHVALILPIPYTYWAHPAAVHDGDTISLDLDLGFDLWLHPAGLTAADPLRTSFRLFGCNARELAEPGGAEAHEHLAGLLPEDMTLMATIIKNDKWGGRYCVTITMPDNTDLVQQLIADQWAAPWDGQGVKPVPPWPRTVTA